MLFSPEVLSEFSDLDFAIYDCVMNNKRSIGKMKIKELADEAHVSPSSVLRFCRKLGCDGYSEFRIKFKESLEPEASIEQVEMPTVLKSFAAETESPDFKRQLDTAYAMIKPAEQLVFVGIGTSGIVGKYGARFFSNVGKFSVHLDDPFIPVLATAYKDIVAIALSESGMTEQTVRLATQLKRRGCALMSITNNSKSVLAKAADFNISYHVPHLDAAYDQTTNLTSQIPVLYILETLALRFYSDLQSKPDAPAEE